MKTLNVKPAVLLKVEDFAVFLVYFSVTMRPYAGLFKAEQGMHPRSEKTGVIFFSYEIQKSRYSVLHGFFEEFRRSERRISLYFHNMQLNFFSEGELR